MSSHVVRLEEYNVISKQMKLVPVGEGDTIEGEFSPIYMWPGYYKGTLEVEDKEGNFKEFEIELFSSTEEKIYILEIALVTS